MVLLNKHMHTSTTFYLYTYHGLDRIFQNFLDKDIVGHVLERYQNFSPTMQKQNSIVRTNKILGDEFIIDLSQQYFQ